MFITKRPLTLLGSIAFLVYGNFTVWHAYAEIDGNRPLRVITMNIGQGDSIYVEAPNGRQMIIDGGRDAKVMSELRGVMPYGDDSIDVIMITNPDSDHMTGFENVMAEYKVGLLVESGTHSDTSTYQRIEQSAKDHNIPIQLARAGERIMLDEADNVYFDILFPDRDVSTWSRNDGSIVGKLVYGQTSYMFMGDATAKTESILLSEYPPDVIKSDVLKLGHHGSRTSTSQAWLDAVQPTFGMISYGCHNTYGHPHAEVIDRLKADAVQYFGTCEHGDVEIDSDGKTLTTKTGK